MGKWLWPWYGESDKAPGETAPEVKEYWVADEVAEVAGVARTTVLNWHKEGWLLPQAFAGRRRIRLYDPTIARAFITSTGRKAKDLTGRQVQP
jgi:hypothetical protein